MMKSYLRYEPGETLGVIASPQAGVLYDFSGHLAVSGAVRDVAVWNLRQSSKVATLKNEHPNYPFQLSGEVVALSRCFDKNKSCIAAGYSDGQIKIFNYITKSLIATLHGHTSAISCFADITSQSQCVANRDPERKNIPYLLASGGCDCDIIIWDLMTLSAVCKLRGHKDAVTDLVFLNQEGTTGVAGHLSRRILISSSKDSLVKVWCLETFHCIQTIVGHRCEVWSLALIGQPNHQRMIVTGSSDEILRGYTVASGNDSKSKPKSELNSSSSDQEGDEEVVLTYAGEIRTALGSDKCVKLSVNSLGNLLAAQSVGKVVEFYHLRDPTEVNKKSKRRIKRMKEKLKNNSQDESFEENEKALGIKFELSDMLESRSVLRSVNPIRGFDFSPTHSTTTNGGSDQVIISTVRNIVEVYRISHEGGENGQPQKLSMMDLHGHRSDVRCVCISTDGRTIATCSNDGLKLWNTTTMTCVRSCKECGYGVAVAFAPGARFVIVCTKEGRVQLIDSASGELSMDENAHSSLPVYGLAIRPDGKGFVTGAGDKVVKFWDFKMDGNNLSASQVREMSVQAEVLSLCYSPTKSNDKLLLCVGMLDGNIKIVYDDSLKFFVSLYGHKLPVLCCDISSDCSVVVTGSADKTVKLWGLDFGDCHRSLFAHSDSVTSVVFQPNTHYFFSSSRDGEIKYWDADRYECVLLLTGHKACVWGMCMTSDGHSLISVGQDRTIRLWNRTDDLVFVEEEREKKIDAEVQITMNQQQKQDETNNTGIDVLTITSAAGIKSGEALIEALDIVEPHIFATEEALAQGTPISALSSTFSSDIKLRKLSPAQFLLSAIRQIPSADLEQVLLILPFHYVGKLIHSLLFLVKRGLEVELCCRASLFTLRSHMTQLSSSIHSAHLRTDIEELGRFLQLHLNQQKLIAGSNLAGLRYMMRCVEKDKNEKLGAKELLSGLSVRPGYIDTLNLSDKKRENPISLAFENAAKKSKKFTDNAKGTGGKIKRKRNQMSKITMAQVMEGMEDNEG